MLRKGANKGLLNYVHYTKNSIHTVLITVHRRAKDSALTYLQKLNYTGSFLIAKNTDFNLFYLLIYFRHRSDLLIKLLDFLA